MQCEIAAADHTQAGSVSPVSYTHLDVYKRQSKDSAPTAEAQLEVVRKTASHIAEISRRGYEMAIVHGNGPQVGRILLSSETARDVVPPLSLIHI